MSWLNSLKVAILNNDTQKALNLIETLPNFDNIDDLICARELVGTLLESLKSEKAALAEQLHRVKQAKKFLED